MATKKASPAQLAARKKFVEMVRSGAFKKRKTNPRKKTVSQKISQLTHEGYPQKQAVAVALSEQRAGKVKRNPIDWKKRDWIAYVDDERNLGHGIIVTLKEGWFFNDGDKNGIRGYDTLTEAKKDTSKNNVSKKNPTRQRANGRSAVMANPIKKKIATHPGKALYKFKVQFKQGKNWKSQGAFSNLEQAKDYAYSLSKNNKNKTIRVIVYTGGE
jgi:hypothetical protein